MAFSRSRLVGEEEEAEIEGDLLGTVSFVFLLSFICFTLFFSFLSFLYLSLVIARLFLCVIMWGCRCPFHWISFVAVGPRY